MDVNWVAWLGESLAEHWDENSVGNLDGQRAGCSDVNLVVRLD